MPKITEQRPFNGALERIERLGLTPLWEELRGVLTGFALRVEERRDANGGAAIRKMIDSQFETVGGWTKTTAGDVDWIKCLKINGARVCLGVEVQFSARSDLLIVDVAHLKEQIQSGSIDVGVMVVPTDDLGYFLTDRAARFSDALKAVERAEATRLPLIVLGLEHDGPGPALKKMRTRQGKEPN